MDLGWYIALAAIVLVMAGLIALRLKLDALDKPDHLTQYWKDVSGD